MLTNVSIIPWQVSYFLTVSSVGKMSADHLRKEIVERSLWVVAQATVDGRDLNDGAAWRDEPVEPFGLAQLAEGTCVGTAGANARDKIKVGLKHRHIQLG